METEAAEVALEVEEAATVEVGEAVVASATEATGSSPEVEEAAPEVVVEEELAWAAELG